MELGSILCEHCSAACCRYLAVPLDKPRRARDYDDIRWYLMHQGISVFIEEGDWYLQIQARCKNLQADNRCGIYEQRPMICREYEPGECDYSNGQYGYEQIFTHPRQIEEFYLRRTGKNLAESLKSKTRTASAESKRNGQATSSLRSGV